MDTLYEQYTQELSKDKYKPIKEDDRQWERELLARYKTTDDEVAFGLLVNANLRFVLFVLKNEFGSIPVSMSKMDLIQAGNVGLIYGIKRFNHVLHPEVRLYSYAGHWIRFEIRKVLAGYVRNRKHHAELMPDEQVEKSTRTGGRDENHVYEYYQKETQLPEEQVAVQDINELLLKVLQPREASIIRDYFGLNVDGKPKTLEAIGQMHHIKFVRVRQLRDRALAKLKEISDDGQLDAYF